MRTDLRLLKKGTEISMLQLESFARKDTARHFGQLIDDLSAHRRKEVLMLEEQIGRIEDLMRHVGAS